VKINGTTFEAKTLGEMIGQGEGVKVVGIENQYVVVSKV
jgi:membrane-bound ClpP family serine protease